MSLLMNLTDWMIKKLLPHYEYLTEEQPLNQRIVVGGSSSNPKRFEIPPHVTGKMV